MLNWNRLLIVYVIYLMFLIVSIESAKKRKYSTGIADLIRKSLKHGLKRFIVRQTSYDSDVFRYTQLTQYGLAGLHAGESCRLSATICSYDDHCCSGRCLCRRWTITGEERCVRKCL